jgi:hypothetical protein
MVTARGRVGNKRKRSNKEQSCRGDRKEIYAEGAEFAEDAEKKKLIVRAVGENLALRASLRH